MFGTLGWGGGDVNQPTLADGRQGCRLIYFYILSNDLYDASASIIIISCFSCK